MCCFSELDIKWPADLERLQVLHDSYRLRVEIVRCSECKQLYAYCFVEVFDDDWDFWCPIDENDREVIEQDYQQALSIINSRKHITRPPSWKSKTLYWHEGVEPALTYGPRSWF